MKIGIQKVVDVDVKTVEISLKVRDEGVYTFKDSDGQVVTQLEGCYVPGFGPDIGGDYMDLTIDLETGKILNWELTASKLKEIINGTDD